MAASECVYRQMRGQLIADKVTGHVTFRPDGGDEFQLPLSPEDLNNAIELQNYGQRKSKGFTETLRLLNPECEPPTPTF